jgi:hypothetical protein
MIAKRKVFRYESPLGPLMERLVREKRATGYKYDTPAWVLKDLDHFLCGSIGRINALFTQVQQPMTAVASLGNCVTPPRIRPLWR